MTDALQAVVDYARMPQTDYAILIDGPWGCGKTYFWKNIVGPRLKEEGKELSHKKVLYASLYGVENTRSIDTQLLLGQYSGSTSKKATHFISGFGGIFKNLANRFVGFDVSSLDLRWLINTNDTVICFDDLERCKLPMEEILGYINHFVEHCNVKTIVICNETEISSGGRHDTYKRMKEKVIGFSFVYQADHSEVFRTLIDLHKENHQFHQFLNTHMKAITEIFRRSKTNNLRALNKTLNALRVVFDALLEGSIDPDRIAKQILYTLCPTAFDLYALGADPDTLRSINSLHVIATVGSSRLQKENDNSVEKAFVDRYYSDRNWIYAIGSPSICEYLITGHLDRRALVQQLKEFALPEDNYACKLKKLHQDAFSMNDDEFTRLSTEFFQDIAGGRIAKVIDLVSLFNIYVYFSNNKLIGQTQQQLLQTFKDGIEKGIKNGNLIASPSLESDLSHPSLKPQSNLEADLRQALLEANKKMLRSHVLEQVEQAKDLMVAAPESFIDRIMIDENSYYKDMPVFNELKSEDVASWIIALTNEMKLHFILGLQARYESSFSTNLIDDIPNLEQVSAALRSHLSTTLQDEGTRSISYYNITQIADEIDRAIHKLKVEST